MACDGLTGEGTPLLNCGNTVDFWGHGQGLSRVRAITGRQDGYAEADRSGTWSLYQPQGDTAKMPTDGHQSADHACRVAV